MSGGIISWFPGEPLPPQCNHTATTTVQPHRYTVEGSGLGLLPLESWLTLLGHASERHRINPCVDNVDKYLRRIRGDLAFVEKCLETPGGLNTAAFTLPDAVSSGSLPKGNDAPEDDAPTGRRPRSALLDHARTQGIVNNLRGFQGELLAAHTAAGVAGLLKRFPLRPATFPTASSVGSSSRVQVPCSSSTAVEVDVVAQGGSAWIEVKNQELFGLESVHWTGTATVKVS